MLLGQFQWICATRNASIHIWTDLLKRTVGPNIPNSTWFPSLKNLVYITPGMSRTFNGISWKLIEQSQMKPISQPIDILKDIDGLLFTPFLGSWNLLMSTVKCCAKNQLSIFAFCRKATNNFFSLPFTFLGFAFTTTLNNLILENLRTYLVFLDYF